MPTSDYACSDCGPFTRMRPIAQREQPAPCPACQATSPRVIAGAPRLGAVEGSTRQFASAQEAAAGNYRRFGHPASCRCC
jgi:putative FmdB family regulatory protein